MKIKKSKNGGNVGILVGGGPAPGINGVVTAVTIGARKEDLTVYGIFDGYKWLTKGDEINIENYVKKLRMRDVSRIHFDGGSYLRTSRTNPIKIKNGVQNCVKNLNILGIKFMVTIGGDDTAYAASEIAKASAGAIKFVHVPKTIDNDLPLPNNQPTFGYQTACDLGSKLVKNLMEDARIMDRWFIAVVMGRHTGHLALGISKSAGATLSIIPEEFGSQHYIPLSKVCDIFEAAIIKRRAMDHNHGVLVIAEGVAERLSQQDLEKIPGIVLEYDDFGNIRLSEVELGKILKLEVERRFKERNDKISIIEINIGYVLRCADPIPFDQEYTRDLGYNAMHYLLSDVPEHQENVMISVINGVLTPLPFDGMIDPETKKTEIRYVDVENERYKIARNYMVRLEKRDFDDPEFLNKMAEAAKMSKEKFLERFRYLVNNDK
ncbi:MAG: 6-phosphofructokinase [bacterium]|nr:MAG: 6-phosphofructokinase [bacterium]